jgi:hypothetical protein
MARAQKARAQLATAFETIYGMPPASGYFKMPFASASLGSEQPLLSSELLGYGRDPLPPVLDAFTAEGDIVVPVDLRAFGMWLKGAFVAPITTGTGPYNHEFRSGSWSLPSLAIELGMPEVPHFGMNAGCVVNTLSWQMKHAGLLTATIGLIAQGETVGAATGAGTPTDWAISRFGQFNGAVKRNGASLGNVVSAQVNYTNNLDRIETIRADGKIDGADPSIAALTGQIVVRFADQTLLNQAVAGTAAELEFSFIKSASESLTFTVHAVFLPKPKLAVQGPQGVQATFTWQAARDSALGRMCTAVLINDVESY